MTSIRPYSPGDRESCLAIFTSNLPIFFAEQELAEFDQWLDLLERELSLESSKAYYFVLTEGLDIIGCGGFYYDNAKQTISMTWGMIMRRYHRKSYGRQLFQYRIDRAKELYPGLRIILDTTQHSRAFFEKFGFKIDKITPDFYAQGLHRYDMSM
jgi:N-acetylglutamate synthase-like GNAT family acetyltransferase